MEQQGVDPVATAPTLDQQRGMSIVVTVQPTATLIDRRMKHHGENISQKI